MWGLRIGIWLIYLGKNKWGQIQRGWTGEMLACAPLRSGAGQGPFVRARHRLVEPFLFLWKVGFTKKKLPKSRPSKSSDEI